MDGEANRFLFNFINNSRNLKRLIRESYLIRIGNFKVQHYQISIHGFLKEWSTEPGGVSYVISGYQISLPNTCFREYTVYTSWVTHLLTHPKLDLPIFCPRLKLNLCPKPFCIINSSRVGLLTQDLNHFLIENGKLLQS